MKVLVTGATGFIGTYVVPELLRRAVQVVATASTAETASRQPWYSQVEFVAHNIEQPASENLFEKFKRPDAMIHLAWGALSDFKSQRHVEEILPAHLAFLTNLLEHGLADLTCTGTCLEYGLQEGLLSEDMDSRPTIAYPMAKHQLRLALEQLQARLHFSLKWVRLFYMYGQGQSPKSILPLLQKALDNKEPVFNMSKGEQVRDYLPVEQVSENIVTLALQRRVTGIINCSSNRPVTIKQLVLDYLEKKHASIEINYGYYPYTDYEPFRFWGDNSKLLKTKS